MNMAESSNKYVAHPKLMALAIGIFGFASIHAAPISGQGTWESTLQARDLDGNMSTVEAYFDTALGITWLANANLAKTYFPSRTTPGISLPSTAPSSTPTSTPTSDGAPTVTISFGENANYANAVNGLLNLTQATAWANDLTIHGVEGWRLPFNKIVNDSPLTEMTHLYTSTLGNSLLTKAMRQVGSGGPSGVTQYEYITVTIRSGGRDNTGPFRNIQSSGDVFWSLNPQGSAASFDDAAFNWGTGYTAKKSSTSNALAWLVHDGDIGSVIAVPEPQTLALMLLGLSAVSLKRFRSHRSNHGQS
jgi:hypothetical protein